MTIHCKAVEQYYTVVPFVFQFYQVCNFGKSISFELGTVRSEGVKPKFLVFYNNTTSFLVPLNRASTCQLVIAVFFCRPQVSPSDPVMLMANAVHEVHLTLRPNTSGTARYMYVNVVGIL